MTEPTFGWPLPVLGDAANVPYDMRQLAEAIAATLSEATTRTWKASSRSTDESGQDLPVAAPVVIPAAPAGLYLAVCLARYFADKTDYTYSYVYTRVNGGSSQEGPRHDSSDKFYRSFAWSRVFAWSGGGDLTLEARLFGTNTRTVLTGSRIDVVRIGS